MSGNYQYDDDFNFEDQPIDQSNSKSPKAHKFKDPHKAPNNNKNDDYLDDFEGHSSGNKKYKALYDSNNDEYGDDFENIEDQPPRKSSKLKVKVKKGNKDNLHKNYSSNKISGVSNSKANNKGREQYFSNKKPSKSFKNLNPQNISSKRHEVDYSNQQYDKSRVSKTAESGRDGDHRYYIDVVNKFNKFTAQKAGIQDIHKQNQQIRETIQKYNKQLTNIINKNLSLFAKNQNIFKVSKKNKIEDAIKVLREQIKNNDVIDERTQKQLKKVKQSKNRMEARESDVGLDSDEEKYEIQEKIKEINKNIHALKLKIEQEGLKLMPQDIPTSIPKAASHNKAHKDMAKIKQHYLVVKKQHQSNEQRLAALEIRQSQLTSKLEQMGDFDQEIQSYKKNVKETSQKKKRYSQTLKKLQNLRNHNLKAQNLWETKATLSAHENHSQKQKLRNMDLQIKNIQESISQVFQRSSALIKESKSKNNNSKLLEKLIEEMKVYEEYSTNKLKREMTKSRLGKFDVRKSMGHVSLQENQASLKNRQEQKTEKQLNKQQKSHKQQENSKEQRVWKQQGQEDNRATMPSKKSVEKSTVDMDTVKKSDETIQKNIDKEKKPFGIRAKKEDPKNQSGQNKKEPEDNGQPLNSNAKSTTNSNLKNNLNGQPTKPEQKEQQKDQPKKFVPKRFAKKKAEQKAESYMPSIGQSKQLKGEQRKKQVQQEQKKESEPSISKPMFKLKRHKQPQQKLVENQFLK